MTEFILLLSLWPFRHKKPAANPYHVDWTLQCNQFAGSDEGGLTLDGEGCVHPEGWREDDCTKQGDLYFYMGEDGLISFSPASCDAAKRNWSVMHIDPVRMSRAEQDIERFPMCDPKHPEVKQCVRPLKPYKRHRWPFLKRRNPFDPKRMSRS